MSIRTPVSLALLAGLCLGASAQQSGDEHREVTAQAVANDPELLRDLRRVLRLEGGGTLRARARVSTEGAWEVYQGGAWRPVGRAVESWKLERDVLAQAKRLAKQVKRDDTKARARLADWMLEEGLEKEGRAELDKVLQLAPDDDYALNLITRYRLGLPEFDGREFTVEVYKEMILAGGDAGPLERELIINRLGGLAKMGTLNETLAHELRTFQARRRSFATHVLRRLLPGMQVRELLRRSVLDSSEEVRRGASWALRDVGEDGLAVPLVHALSSSSAAIRTNAAESLGNLGVKAALPALVTHYSNLGAGTGGAVSSPAAHIYIGRQFAYVGDFDVEIASGASIADPIVMVGTEGAVLDVRLHGISGYTLTREVRTTQRSLEQLAGTSPGKKPADWQRWLAKHPVEER